MLSARFSIGSSRTVRLRANVVWDGKNHWEMLIAWEVTQGNMVSLTAIPNDERKPCNNGWTISDCLTSFERSNFPPRPPGKKLRKQNPLRKKGTPHIACEASLNISSWMGIPQIFFRLFEQPIAEKRSMSATFPERTNAVAAVVISISSGIAAFLLRFGPLSL